MKIKITRSSLTYIHTILMDDKTKQVLSDGQPTTYNADKFKFKLCTLVSDWPETLIDESVIDGLKYEIKIKSKEGLKIYSFKNKFPEDISRLECLINDVIMEEIDV